MKEILISPQAVEILDAIIQEAKDHLERFKAQIFKQLLKIRRTTGKRHQIIIQPDQPGR